MSEDGQAPTVSISAPAVMVPPTAAQTLVVAPGSPLTFSGLGQDDEHPQQRRDHGCATAPPARTSPRTAPGAPTCIQDWYRISPVNLNGTSYNWSYTTPFNLKPGNYSFEVRATDDLGLDDVVGQPGQAHRQRPGGR